MSLNDTTWHVDCPTCGAKGETECCSTVSGCVLDKGHLSRINLERKHRNDAKWKPE